MSQSPPNPSEVTELDLSGREDVKGDLAGIDGFTNLQILRLDRCASLTELPEKVCNLHSLKDLSLQDCPHMISLPDAFWKLSTLQLLNLKNCRSLKELPPRFGEFSALEGLNLCGCENLKELNKEFGQLENLENLDVSGCSSLRELPSSFENLRRLRFLDLNHCDGLEHLPSGFGSLSSLQSLDLSFCYSLVDLPQTFGTLWALGTLNLEFCQNLRKLPETFGDLSSLSTLRLTGCEDLEALPADFGRLKSLRRMEFMQDRSIASGMETLPESVGELSAMEELTLRCPNLKNLPQSFSRLSNLRDLDLSGCESLSSLPDNIRQLEALKFLNIQFCSNLRSVWNDSRGLVSLKAVNAADCKLDGDALDQLLGVKSLILLYIAWSYEMIDRWEQLKERNQDLLWVICERPAPEVESFVAEGFDSAARETVSRAFFHHHCKFVDADGHVADESFPAGGAKLALLFAMADLSSSGLEMVKRKCTELVEKDFRLVYVALWEQSEEDVRGTLARVLPGGQAWAWIGGEQRRRDFFGFSVIFSEMRGKENLKSFSAFIATASVTVDSQRRKWLGEWEVAFTDEEEHGNDLQALMDGGGGFQRLYKAIREVINRMAEGFLY